MNKGYVYPVSILATLFLFLLPTPAHTSTDCNYFSASIKVWKPFTKVKSPVKAVTFYWAGVNVTINGDGQLVSTAASSITYRYDKKNKRYSSMHHNGHAVYLKYFSSPNKANQGNILTISRSSANIIRFKYNKYGYLKSVSYRGNRMSFYYNSDGSLKHISQPVPVKCVYATFEDA